MDNRCLHLLHTYIHKAPPLNTVLFRIAILIGIAIIDKPNLGNCLSVQYSCPTRVQNSEHLLHKIVSKVNF